MTIRSEQRKCVNNSHNALELLGVSKEFDGRPALLQASFSVKWGEVHALLGENGAGKSTLMNVACGLYAPDEVIMAINGVPIEITKPADAIRNGIGMVHQHFKLVGRFTVAENIFLSCSGALGASSIRDTAASILEKSRKLKLGVDPFSTVGEISVAEQQRVEILKILLAGARILILDEPTAVLTERESESVLALLRDMAGDGCAVILITHKLREVIGYSDRVTVMREGKAIMNGVTTAGLAREDLTRAMVGTTAEGVKRNKSEMGGDRNIVTDLRIASHSGGVGLDGVSFRVRSGEIYGIAGVGGNGQSELADALMGLSRPESGSVTIDGVNVAQSSVAERRARGLRFIPADRYRAGLVADLPAYENFGMTEILKRKYGSWLRVDRRRMKDDTDRAINMHQISGCTVGTKVNLLSGGNAQKLLLSRELDGDPGTIIAHSPTRGLDVQARNTVHRLLLEASERAAACILISEDLEEILALSSTIAVMSRGRIVGEFPAPDASREKIGELMLGHA